MSSNSPSRKRRERRVIQSIALLTGVSIGLSSCTEPPLSKQTLLAVNLVREASELGSVPNRKFSTSNDYLSTLSPYKRELKESLNEGEKPIVHILDVEGGKYIQKEKFFYVYEIRPLDPNTPVYWIHASRNDTEFDGKDVQTTFFQIEMRNDGCDDNGISSKEILKSFGSNPKIIIRGLPLPPDSVPFNMLYHPDPVFGCSFFHKNKKLSNATIEYKNTSISNNPVITIGFNGFGKVKSFGIKISK